MKKVIFKLTKPTDLEFTPDETRHEQKQREERMKEREGILHAWHDMEEKSAYSDNYLIKKIAIIEDIATGEIYEVSHNNIKFVNK